MSSSFSEDYEEIACDAKIPNGTIIPLDTFKVAHLKKITRIDTITRNAMGNFWYAKINIGSAEFYTSDGFHPKYTAKKLKPISLYILNKYIQHNQ